MGKLVTEKWGSFGASLKKAATNAWNTHKGTIMGAAQGLWNQHKGKIMGAAAGLAKKWMGGGGQSEAASGGYGYSGGWENELVQKDDDHVQLAAALIALNGNIVKPHGVSETELAALKKFQDDVRKGAPGMYEAAMKLDSMPVDELRALLELPADSQPVKLVTEKWGSFGASLKKAATNAWNTHKGTIMGAAQGLWNQHKGKIMGAAAGLAKKWMGGGGQSEAASGGYGYSGGWENELVQEQTEEDDDRVQLAAALIALSGSYVKPSDMSATELAAFTTFQNDVKEQAPGMYAAAMKLDSMPAEDVTALLQLPADSQPVKLVTKKWKDVRSLMHGLG